MTENINKPLSGVRVLDFTQVMSGPFCSLILADLGAEIIKIEPESGDASRKSPPFKENESIYFKSLNRSKKSVSVNLKTVEGKNIVYELIKKSDVILENFRSGKMDSLSLGYDKVKEINNKIIYQSISGYGRDSIEKNRSAYDLLIQAETGALFNNGTNESLPVKIGLPISDFGASLYAVISILSSIIQKQGGRREVNMFDSQLSLMTYKMCAIINENSIEQRYGSEHQFRVPSGLFQTGNELIAIHATTKKFFSNLCHALDRPSLITDPLFCTNDLRVKNRGTLNSIIEATIESKDASFWQEKFKNHDVPYAIVQKIKEAVKKRKKNNNLFFAKTENGFDFIKSPMEGVVEVDKMEKDSPKLGEHSCEVLISMLGYTEKQIEKLVDDKIIFKV